MQFVLTKVNSFITSVVSLLLDNGSGRAAVENTKVYSDPSGFSVFIKTIARTILDFLLDIAMAILRLLAQIAYFIAKIALNIMDFMNIIIKELSGQAVNYASEGNSNLLESDILFRFLFNDLTIKILKSVFIFSLLLLIIFTIVAIFKQEWENRAKDKVGNFKKVLRKTVLAIFTMIITPFIVIIGIVFSNVLLSSGMSALTDQSGSYSIGAQIFSASSYEANMYRKYAEEARKIPIVFDYDGGFQNSISASFPEYNTSSTKEHDDEIDAAIASGNFTTGQTTYNMFKDETFYSFENIGDGSSYYELYDGPYLKTKQIEYFAMADFVDYAMQTGGHYYLVNVEDVYRTAMYYAIEKDLEIDTGSDPDKPKKDPYEMGKNAVKYVIENIKAYDDNGSCIVETDGSGDNIYAQIANNASNANLDHYTFDVYYNEGRADHLKTSGFEDNHGTGMRCVNYTSVAGANDEVTGAKYIFCTLEQIDEYEYVYKPVTIGDKTNGIYFKSNFLASSPLDADTKEKVRSETMFLARGLFTKMGYPTAIKNEGNNIHFYRHDTNAPSIMDFSQIFNYESGESSSGGSTMSGANIIEFLTGVDVSTLIPDIRVNLNFMQVFSKSKNSTATLDSGHFTLNYSFVGSGVKMANIYDALQINYVLLLFAIIGLFTGLFYVIWGLILRIYEITLLWITMPGWISKFPLDKGDNITDGSTAFGKWKTMMIERVLALFSIYLALGLVFMLVPIVFNMDFITTFGIPENNIFGIFNADIANLALKTAFVLVLFTFLKLDKSSGGKGGEVSTIPEMLEEIILLTGRDGKSGYLSQTGRTAFEDIKKQVTRANTFFNPVAAVKAVKAKALSEGKRVVNAIPGKAVVDHLVDFGSGAAKKIKDYKNGGSDIERAQDDLLNATDEESIKNAAENLSQTTREDAYTSGYEQARKDYWRDTNKGNKKDFRKRPKEFESELSDVAKKGGGAKIKFGNKKIKARALYRKMKRKRTH